MKTIEPNSNEDVVSHYNAVSIEFISFLRNPNGVESSDYERIIWGYESMIRFLEKNIKDRELYN